MKSLKGFLLLHLGNGMCRASLLVLVAVGFACEGEDPIDPEQYLESPFVKGTISHAGTCNITPAFSDDDSLVIEVYEITEHTTFVDEDATMPSRVTLAVLETSDPEYGKYLTRSGESTVALSLRTAAYDFGSLKNDAASLTTQRDELAAAGCEAAADINASFDSFVTQRTYLLTGSSTEVCEYYYFEPEEQPEYCISSDALEAAASERGLVPAGQS